MIFNEQPCALPPGGRRRLFWTTQPAPCGERELCGRPCGNPGLELVPPEDECGTCSCCGNQTGSPDCPKPMCEKPRTIKNTDWVRSLAINMLLTDARREDRVCGWRPGTMNGHWSESFVEQAQPFGTSLRYIPTLGSIHETVRLIKTHVQFTLNKLVAYKVATGVDVEVKYLGGGVVSLDAVIYGQSGSSAKVGLTGARLSNAWVWS